MNYSIITDYTELRKFIDWLPDLKDNETFYYSLFARKKYCPELVKSNDKTQLKRGVSNKEKLIQKIEQLELPVGKWKLKGQQAPQESLVLYLMPNPRNVRKAAHMASMKFQKMVFEGATNYNPIAEVTSCIQRSKSRSYVVDFDIDSKDIDLEKIHNYFHSIKYNGPTDHYDEVFTIIETKGGYHILIKPDLASLFSKTWYQDIMKMYPCDQAGDQLLPVPGTTQGGFTPKIIEI